MGLDLDYVYSGPIFISLDYVTEVYRYAKIFKNISVLKEFVFS